MVLSGAKKLRTNSANFASPAASTDGNRASITLMSLITTLRVSTFASVRAWIETTPGVGFPPTGVTEIAIRAFRVR